MKNPEPKITDPELKTKNHNLNLGARTQLYYPSPKLGSKLKIADRTENLLAGSQNERPGHFSVV